MKITEHLKKDYWVRRVVPDRVGTMPIALSLTNYKNPPYSTVGSAYQNLTNEDFMNEFSPTAHKAFSEYLSKRAVWRPTGKKDEQGREEWVIDRYDDVVRVVMALQQTIALKKASHFAADGLWLADESNNKERFDKLLSWKDSVGIDKAAWLEAVLHAFTSGDSAVYQYQIGNDIEYKVFSSWKGDTLYPDMDEDGNDVLWREYTLKGKRAVDYYGVDYVDTWIATNDEDKGLIGKLRKLIKRENDDVVKSEDGFTRIRHQVNQIGNDLCPATYFRVTDVPWGIAQEAICTLEEMMSYAGEEFKSSAFPVLFVKSGNMTSLPPMDANGKTIGVKGDVEMVKASDAKFLTPPDASNIAEIVVGALKTEIEHSTFTVFIEPEILKSGADSSTTIKILFTPEIQWCQTMWTQFFQPAKRMMEVFKRLVGKVEGDPIGYGNMRFSLGQNIWIPQNEAELVDIMTKKVYARIISREAAMVDLGDKHIGDYDKINKEWEHELEIKARIPAEVKAKFGESSDTFGVEEEPNPDKTGVDNNDKGKSIQE